MNDALLALLDALTPANLAVAVLAAVAIGGIAYVVIYPWLSGEKRVEERQKALVGSPAQRAAERLDAATANKREQVAQSLREIEARERRRNRLSLEMRVTQAGLDWSRGRFFLVSAGLGLATALLFLALTHRPLVGLTGLFVGSLGVPRWLLSQLRTRRMRRFIEELPNALDVVVRGVRAGLPLGDCLKIIASEAAEPVRSEFRAIVEAQALGLSVADACARLPERMPVPEANFFAIVIAIQQKAGGNLSEALANLSRVLRERKKMKDKIQAMSMEAKASAAIIASLPFVVAILVYITSPSYIELLWLKDTGKIALALSGAWMLIGIMVMRNMINFDF